MNFKELIEKRNEMVEKLNAIVSKCETEKRSVAEAEQAEFDALTKEIQAIDKTIKMAEEARSYEAKPVEKEERKAVDQYALECRAFAQYIRKGLTSYKEDRADVNFTFGDNGAVIPSTIANKIIETVENICPIYALSTKFHIKGSLSFPVYDESTQKVEAEYATEFTALDSTSGKFSTVALGGYLVGVLTKISRSLINNAQFDVTSYAITKIAQAIARFLEKELLLGETKISGAVPNATVYEASDDTTIAPEDLIALQIQIPQVNQANCRWVMNNNTLLALRELKDSNGRFYLQDNLVQGFGYTLLGKPVDLSDQMDDIEAESLPILYGDMSAMYVNIREDISMQMLTEKFADEHAIGAVAWVEMDGKLIEKQKMVVLQMAES